MIEVARQPEEARRDGEHRQDDERHGDRPGRLVRMDLLRVVHDDVAHPEFYGSYSMKHVAPAVAHELTYADLDIADGGEASASFYRIVADHTL